MSEKLAIIRSFVEAHRGKFAAIATAAVLLALVARDRAEFNKFLKEKGLYDTYYAIED